MTTSADKASVTTSADDTRRPRCSELARQRGDPLIGTAPPARRWLLVELESRWLPTAVDSLGLEQEARSELTRSADRAQARIMLIRRPGRTPPPESGSGTGERRRAWCVVDDPGTAAGPVTTWGTWASPEGLLEAGRVLAEQSAAEDAATRRTRAGTTDAGPAAEPGLLLVCAHGRHDVCCATRGRPVAAALAARWPEATWECSHTGGDRFAANLIVLPDGACYGGLDPDSAVEVVGRHHAGAPDTAYLRGRTGWPRPAQAALLAAHRAMPEAAWGSFVVEEVRSSGAEHVVHLSSGRTRVEVPVTEQSRSTERLTCAAAALGTVVVPVAGQARVRT